MWSLLLLMARSEEIAEQAVRSEEVAAPGQARVRGGPGLPLLLPEAAVLGAPRRERRPARLPGAGGGRFPAADGAFSPTCSASPSRSACEPRANREPTADRHHDRLQPEGARDLPAARRLRAVGGDRPAACPLVLAPGRPGDAGELLDRVDGLLLTGGADVEPAPYGEAPHPTRRPGAARTRRLRAGADAARPWPGTSRSSLSVGAIRC